jgi:hypothetical protein
MKYITIIARGINVNIVASCLINMSSRTGFTNDARAAVVAPTTSMQNMARMNFAA